MTQLSAARPSASPRRIRRVRRGCEADWRQKRIHESFISKMRVMRSNASFTVATTARQLKLLTFNPLSHDSRKLLVPHARKCCLGVG